MGQRWFGRMVCHSLLVETSDRLVLVDTGFGLDDVRSPMRRLTPAMPLARADLRPENTAAMQVEQLGFARSDVRDIAVTHLDLDHAGGLPDFPEASVHIHRPEHDAAMSPQTMNEKQRYRPVHFAHGPKWNVHDAGGERWMGFESVRAVADDVLVIPLPGHTRGHSCIAVKAPTGERFAWYLHCGDAYFKSVEKTDPSQAPSGIKAFQRLIAHDDELRRANARRLRELHASEDGKRVKIFSAHCPTEYAELASPRVA
jgi:glyoxylase-like metal-dependent hydrolase (beta-lactamase superfamily II)